MAETGALMMDPSQGADGTAHDAVASNSQASDSAALGNADILDLAAAWRAQGHGVALATVVATWGSSPRPTGSQLVVHDGGVFQGSVSGGCIEGAVIGEALEVISGGQPRLLDFGVSDEQAWDVGLACGGKVQVFVERVD